MYENDEEIVNDLDKVNYWYQKLAKSDHELGKDIKKDALMAFQFYKKLTERGYISGNYKLGYCYNHGI